MEYRVWRGIGFAALFFVWLPVFVPVTTLAEAGFPSHAIWASKSSAVEGDVLVVSTVVHNGEPTELRGTVVFLADDTRIGAREFELAAGGSQIHSIEWKPRAGEYELRAAIEGTSAELTVRETPGIRIVVAPPEPSPTARAVSTVVETAGAIASSSLPAVRGAATALFNAIEPFRQAGVERLENYLESAPGKWGHVAGTSTSNASGFGAQEEEAGPGVLSKIAQTAAAAALFTMKNLYLFYPLLAVIVLGALYSLARRIRRS